MDKNKKICNLIEKKIVFFDIDDTLYAHNIGVPDSAVQGIRALRDNGHLAFICTGRSRAMIFPSMTDIGFDGIIAGGGTYAECNGREIFRYNMEESEAERVIKKLREFGFIPVPEGHDYLYFEDQSRWTENYRYVFEKFHNQVSEKMAKIPEDATNVHVSKVSAVFTEKSKLEEAKKFFENDYTVVNHKNSLLELIPLGYSKAVGIEKVITALNILPENTYAFGDSMNDYEMLSYVKHSVAMGNAHEKILKLAKYTTDTVENDGIYKGLSMLGLI